MPIIKSAPMTVLDSSSNINLELFIASNLPTSQIMKSDGTATPSWVSTPLKLQPSVYVSNTLLSNPSITWQRRSGSGSYTDLISGESVSNGVLTVNQNLLTTDSSGIITYKCTVTYGAITRFAEITYSLNVVGNDGKDGSSVRIIGTAYTVEEETSYVLGQNYILYSDSGLTVKITGADLGDGYLVNGYLFTYSGSSNDQFNYVGNIQGVGITSITGPVSNGAVDTYTIHYSDGTTTTYDVVNGKSVFVTYNDSDSMPSFPTGNGTANGWHTDMTENSVWMSQKVADSSGNGTWGAPVRFRGIDGKGILSTNVSYQASTSGVSVPTGTWQTTIPYVGPGQYLWTRIETNYTDDSNVNAYSVGRIGENGVNGSAGRGVKDTEVTYKAHTSGTSAPTGIWSVTIPEVPEDQYLWTRTVITYTDNTETTSYNVGKIGKDGYDGISVVLTNEAHTFAGTTSAAIAGNVTCNVLAYNGISQVPATIGAITGAPTGMSVSILNNGTTNANFTVSVTSSMRTASGFLTVPVTVGTNTFNKTFSYAIAFKGATGEKGTDGVIFNIYSEDGFVFQKDQDIITLRLQKMHGANPIAIGGATSVQWSKFVNDTWVTAWKHDSGDTNNVTTNAETLLVRHEEISGSQLYKCVLTYGGVTYTDVVTITDKLDAYQSQIIAIGGNVLTGGDTGVVAYAVVFHEAVEEDPLLYPIYEEGTTPVANATYYVVDDGKMAMKKYTNGSWVDDTSKQQDYNYSWFILDQYTGEEREIGSGKVVYISTDVVSSSGIVQCRINDVSMCTEVFADTNDPIVSATTPLSTSEGQLWYNTSDNVLYVYNSEEGEYIPVNNGKSRTYLSAPVNMTDGYYYHKGDLWIVDDADSAYTNASPGSLLIAINDFISGGGTWDAATWKTRLTNDWESKLYYDSKINEILDYQYKLYAYFDYQVDGLKIGATNTEFYTKVTPYDLGFYQGVEKVAYINNNKMYNTSLEVSNDVQIVNHKSDTQPDPQKPYLNLGNYKFIIEENNSLSIAYTLISAPIPSISNYGVFNSYINLFFEPWSTQNSYGYVSSHNTTEKDNIVVTDLDGNVIETTVATGRGYLQVKATSFPDTVIVHVPARSVYNKGVSGNTLGYDTVESPNDAITLTLNKN